MKTRNMVRIMIGATLMCGTALAQAEGPQGPGPRGEEQGFRPEGASRERPEREARREHRGPEGMARPQMPRGGPCCGMAGGRDGFLNPQWLQAAGVTDPQLAALKKAADEQQLKRIDLNAAQEKAELAYEQQMRDDSVDEKTVLKLADALIQARGERFKFEIVSRLKAREILGAEVLKKLRTMEPPEGGGHPCQSPRPEDPPCKAARPEGDRLPAAEQR
ncbi:MAG TPA: hypothetical protein PKM57_08135 [Kiritimatiellia bacterium]|nr:hypothetical protein [Kiritimatiellia bacterium]HPS06684.1 hypothetical protein [Kiritimatiellia bacterium]